LFNEEKIGGRKSSVRVPLRPLGEDSSIILLISGDKSIFYMKKVSINIIFNSYKIRKKLVVLPLYSSFVAVISLLLRKFLHQWIVVGELVNNLAQR
jgi:hypothetical protein